VLVKLVMLLRVNSWVMLLNGNVMKLRFVPVSELSLPVVFSETFLSNSTKE
jgi:hypothetical protein